MPIFWMLTRDAWPDSGHDDNNFTAFDDEVRFPAPFPGYLQYRPQVDAEYIGGVSRVPHGSEEGLWHWTMTVALPGAGYASPTSGKVESRGEAGRKVIETYLAYMATRPESYTR